MFCIYLLHLLIQRHAEERGIYATIILRNIRRGSLVPRDDGKVCSDIDYTLFYTPSCRQFYVMPRYEETTYNGGQDKGDVGGHPNKIDFGNLLNGRVWEAIEKDLGVVTDVRLTHHEGYSSITYKSNGEDKKISIGGNNIKLMLVSFHYYEEANRYDGIKQYQAFY